MASPEKISIEVAYACPDKQRIVPVEVRAGTTAIEAARESEIDRYFPEIDFDHCDLGVFGQKAEYEQVLEDGDRVEIYRALKADPREVRRQLAAQGKTMGSRGKKSDTPG